MSCVDGVVYRVGRAKVAHLTAFGLYCVYAFDLYLISHFLFAEILTCWPACTSTPIRYFWYTYAFLLLLLLIRTTGYRRGSANNLAANFAFSSNPMPF
jgi:hypothetical protein